ncbi:MAG TPA: LamG-like jellyroll fold domain-containing protein [Actinoplanes sp.]
MPKRSPALDDDSGFTLLETIVSIFVVSVVMTSLTMFFVRSVGLTAYQGNLQTATQLAATASSKVRSMNGALLTAGRDANSVQQQWTTGSGDVKAAPYLSGMVPVWDTLAANGLGTSAPLPTTAQPVRVNGVTFEQNFYVGACWQLASGGACTTTQDSVRVPFFQVLISIVWSNKQCAGARCSYLTSTLVSSQAGEPLFNSNATAKPPKITNPGDQIGPLDSAATLQLVATGGAPALTWSYSGLPAGLTGNPATGRITGTLTPAGVFSVVVTVRDAFNLTATAAFTWTVTSPLDYPQTVLDDAPWAYHRLEEAPSTAATSAAADASPNNRPGTYAGTTNGPSLRWSLDEASGAAAADRSGAANPGTKGTGATWTTLGRIGNALSFNGTANAYVGGTDPAVDTGKSFTVSAWVTVTSVAASSVYTAVSQPGALGTAFSLQEYNGKWRFAMTQQDAAASPGESVSSTAAAQANTWTHLTGVYNSTTNQMTLYVDGVLQGSVAHTVKWNATQPIQLGRARYNNVNTEFFSGKIDEVRTHRRALPAAEVAILAADPAGLYWPFEDGTGSTTLDLAGGDDNGTLGSSVDWAGPGNGRFGNAVTFNDNFTTGYVKNNRAVVRTDQSFTVSAWVYLTAASNNGFRTAVSQCGVQVCAFYLQRNRDNGKWVLNMPEADVTSGHVVNLAYSTAPAAADRWTHLVARFDRPAQQLSLWVDGVLQQSAAHTAAHSWHANGPVQVGRGYFGGWVDAWEGSIDEVQLYDRALSADEIRSLADEPDMTAELPGALRGSQANSNAVAFAGGSNGYTNASVTNPTTFTLECWFKVAGTHDGALMGFSPNRSGIVTPTNNQPVMYVDSGGRLAFGVSPGSSTVLRSTASVTDSTWHHAVASLGAGGRKLYLDGQLVASGPSAGAQSYSGYWRWGGLQLGTSWPNRPSNAFLVGALDEVAIYTTQLTDAKVLAHYQSN